MSRFTDATREVLRRHPAPALSVSELKELLHRELPSSGADFLDPAVLERLAVEGRRLRLISEPRRRWIRGLGPSAWVLGERAPGAAPSSDRTLLGRLRTSLRTMAPAVDAASVLAWARWNHLMAEEREVRRHFDRRPPAPRVPDPPRPRRRARTTRRLPGRAAGD